MPKTHLFLLSASFLPAAPSPASPDLVERVVESYVTDAHLRYAEVRARGEALGAAVDDLLAEPSEAHLEQARGAWIAARRIYGTTEVLRFFNGPIDRPVGGVETLLNAWPLDESYLDSVREGCLGGIVCDVERHPNLSAELLEVWNERGGETNVCTGWHAIEFLLWGQDLSLEGPGTRPATDYAVGLAPHADRRGQVLRILTDLLVEHLTYLEREWAPGTANFAAEFAEMTPDRALRSMLTGMIVLSGFELTGERLAVAYETLDAEQEHSCFSDTTHFDLYANQLGLIEVWQGRGADSTGLRELVAEIDPPLAALVDEQLEGSLERLRAIPVPFDRALVDESEGGGRERMLEALLALEAQSESLATAALALGFEIAIRPGG